MKSASYISKSNFYMAHAKKRMAQRNLKLNDIEFVIENGQKIHRTGAVFYFFRKKDIPKGMEKDATHLVGIAVIVLNKNIITTYRNPKAISKIKRKPKINYRKIVQHRFSDA